MKSAIKRDSWCDNPDTENSRELSDLYKVGRRVDAWRDFFHSRTVDMLMRLDGAILWFNRWEYFDRLICEFDCSKEIAVETITGLMIAGHELPMDFIRNDIYDSRAWCNLPLDCFVDAHGFSERTCDDIPQYEVLKYNQMPILQLGIKKVEWTVTLDCFTFSHKLKDGERFAQITFDHPQLRAHFKGRRWCADGKFDRSATRKQMEDALFAKVITECQKYQVEIKGA